MSNTETWKGKLTKIETELSIEEWLKDYCDKSKIVIHDYYDSITEQFSVELDENDVCVISGGLYKIEKEELSDDIQSFTKNKNGEIEFLVSFYNGGTCLSEMLEEGLEKIQPPK